MDGHLEVLRYAHKYGCPWNEKTFMEAVDNGHLEIIKHAHEYGCTLLGTSQLAQRLLVGDVWRFSSMPMSMVVLGMKRLADGLLEVASW
jgi:hypothetical protein